MRQFYTRKPLGGNRCYCPPPYNNNPAYPNTVRLRQNSNQQLSDLYQFILYLSQLPHELKVSIVNNLLPDVIETLRQCLAEKKLKPRVIPTNSAVDSVAYSPDGRFIASGLGDNTIRIWNAKTGDPIGKPLAGHTSFVTSVVYSPDGRFIASGSWDNTIRIWDTLNHTQVGTPLAGHTSAVTSVAYSPDGNFIASGSWDNTIRIWDTLTHTQVGTPLVGHTSSVTSIAYSPDGDFIASGSHDKTIRIWDVKTGAVVREPLTHTDAVYSVAYSPDGQFLSSGSYYGIIRTWNTMNYSEVGIPLHKDFIGAIETIAYRPDGQFLASGASNGTIHIWDTSNRQQVGPPLNGHTGLVYSVAYSPDGNFIVSGSADRTIRIWDTRIHTMLGDLEAVNHILADLLQPQQDSQQLSSRAILLLHLLSLLSTLSRGAGISLQGIERMVKNFFKDEITDPYLDWLVSLTDAFQDLAEVSPRLQALVRFCYNITDVPVSVVSDVPWSRSYI